MSNVIVIGIDLGTTNSCMAYYHKGRPEVIVNQDGDRTTPSYVAFTDDGYVVVGKLAKRHARDAKNIIFDVKRFLGKKYKDVEKELKTYPFEVINCTENGRPLFKVPIKSKTQFEQYEYLQCYDDYLLASPEAICALILEKLKEAAQERLGDGFTGKVVITVPAYFNIDQRQATEEAGKMAGLQVVRLINEPTAAAIAYVHDHEPQEVKRLAVFDFGGGTFDISIIEVERKTILVKAIDGNAQLGGKDIDDLLLQKYMNDIRDRCKYDRRKTSRLMYRLRRSCEEAKKTLSTQKSVNMDLDVLIPSNDDDESAYHLELTRSEFNRLNENLLAETMLIMRKCLTDNNIAVNDIDEVVLVGGSSRIPRITELVGQFFGSEKISKKISADEAVALGAAIQAYLLSSNPSEAMEDILRITDVLSISLGTDIENDAMSFIIMKNTPLPAERTKNYKTMKDFQDSMIIRILEGEGVRICENLELGHINITNLTKAPRGEVIVQVTFHVNENGILHVTATERHSGRKKELQISLSKGNILAHN